MSVNPTTFRFPFKHPDDVTDQGFRLMQQGILDLNQAIASLHSQVQTNATNVKNVTQQINASTTTITGTTLPVNVNQQTADYILQQSDFGGVVVFSGTGPYALTPNQGITQPFFTSVLNLSSGNVVVTPVVPNLINNLTAITILPTQWAIIFFDSINWWALDLQAFPVTKTAVAHEFFVSYDATTGLFVAAQPAIADLSDAANVVQTSRTISTTAPLTGGGDLSANRTLAVSLATSLAVGVVKPDGTTITVDGTGTITSVGGGVPTTRQINTTVPLTGGGDLSADRTLAISNFVGDTGTGGVKGAVPAPAAGDAAAGKFLKADGNWAAPPGGGSGTVTSVALTAPAEFSVAGSPVTTSGTLAITKANENANTVWAGPTTGAAATPAFRTLVAADIPAIPSTETDVTSSRAINGTVYHNTGTKPLFVQMWCSKSTTGNVQIFSDTTTTPTRQIAGQSLSNGFVGSFFFVVPAGSYYKATVNTGSATVNLWLEYSQ